METPCNSGDGWNQAWKNGHSQRDTIMYRHHHLKKMPIRHFFTHKLLPS